MHSTRCWGDQKPQGGDAQGSGRGGSGQCGAGCELEQERKDGSGSGAENTGDPAAEREESQKSRRV